MSWNYRVTRRTVQDEVAYEIREVYYSVDGKIKMWSTHAMAPFGETKDELKQNLEQMMSCLTEPVLDLDTDEWISEEEHS